MTQHTREWVAKAEEDFQVANWILQAPVASPSAIAFHRQQFIEKYLKALLVERGKDVPRTHDLTLLANLLPDIAFDAAQRTQLRVITSFAVEHRYPGTVVSEAEARDVVDRSTSLRQHLRALLGLDP